MSKVKKTSKKDKANRLYRVFSDYLETIKSDDSKFINDNRGFFINSIKYEIYFCFKLIAIANYFNLTIYTTSILIRRYIEALALFNLSKIDNLLLKVNYQLFRLKAQDRVVGKNEENKLKKELLLSRKIDFISFLKSSQLTYLHGVINDEINFNKLINLFEINQDLDNPYRFYSKIIHNISFDNLNSIDNEIKNRYLKLRDLMKKEENDFKEFNKKIISKGLNSNNYVSFYESEFLKFKNKFKDFSKLLNDKKENYYNRYFDIFLFNLNYLRDIHILFLLNEERGAYITIKPYLEKAAIFFTAINFDYVKFNDLISLYFKISSYSISKEFIYSKKIDNVNELLDDCYLIFSKYINMNKYVFKTKVMDNPQTVIIKSSSYLDRVTNLLKKVEESEYEYNLNIYKKSIEFSHVDGYLLTKKDDDYLEEIRSIIRFVFDFLRYVFNKISNVNECKDDDILKALHEFENALDEFAIDTDNLLTKYENNKK